MSVKNTNYMHRGGRVATNYTEAYKNDIDLIEKTVRTLEEYKTRIISDIVTGKIDVRGVEIPEYEYVEEDDKEESDTDGEDRMVEL